MGSAFPGAFQDVTLEAQAGPGSQLALSLQLGLLLVGLTDIRVKGITSLGGAKSVSICGEKLFHVAALALFH